MSRVIGYKLIQAEGNRALAAEVMHFVPEWEPLGGATMVVELIKTGDTLGRMPVYTQAIVKREPLDEALALLEAKVAAIREQFDAADSGLVSDGDALHAIGEVLR